MEKKLEAAIVQRGYKKVNGKEHGNYDLGFRVQGFLGFGVGCIKGRD